MCQALEGTKLYEHIQENIGIQHEDEYTWKTLQSYHMVQKYEGA